MAKSWQQVASSPQFQALSPQDQESARQQYFQQVVTPQLDPSDIASARAQFDAQTKPKQSNGIDPLFAGAQTGVSGTKQRYADYNGPTLAPSRYGDQQPVIPRQDPQQKEGNAVGFLDALQHHLTSAPVGLAQLASHGIQSAVHAVAPGSTADNSVAQFVGDRDAGLQQQQQAYQNRTQNNAGTLIGAGIGEIAPWALGIGEAKAAGMLPQAATLPGKIGALALEGGVMGASQPVTNGGGSYWQDKAIQTGSGAALAPVAAGVGNVAARAAGATGTGIANLVNRYSGDAGIDRLATQRAGKQLAQAGADVSQLRQPTPLEGFPLSAAQANPTPEMIAAERVQRNTNGVPFEYTRNAQNVAARQAVESVGQTPETLQDAITARSQGPGQFWRDNLTQGAPDNRYSNAQGVLKDFMNSNSIDRPVYNQLDQAQRIIGQIQRGTIDAAEGEKQIRALQLTGKAGKAMDQALGVIDGGMIDPTRIVNTLQPLTKHTDPSIRGTANDLLQSIALNQDGMGYVPASAMDGLRQNIGATLAKNSPLGNTPDSAIFGPLKAKIVSSIERSVPGFRNNLADYARRSQTINDMRAGQRLAGRLDWNGPDAFGHSSVNVSDLKQALRADDKERFGLSDSARTKLENVLDSLNQARSTNNTIRASGPGTAGDLASILKSGAGTAGKGALGILLTGLGGHEAGWLGGAGGALASLALNAGLKKGDAKIAQGIASKFANSEEAAKALELYQNQQNQRRLRGAFGQSLLPYTTPGLIPGR